MKNLKKLILLIAVIVTAVVCFAFSASAYVNDGYYTYTVSDGKATITDVNTSISGNITIPSTLGGYSVTTIGDHAFYNCYSLTSVTIPDSVTTIGFSVFYNCYSLTSVTISDSVTTIGSSAFRDCYSLKSVTIPNSVTTIGNSAFYYCDSLTSVTIGDSVTTIGKYAFYDCNSLTSVTIPDSVTTIGAYAFSDCESLTSVTIPDSVTTIGDYAFTWCYSLTNITVDKDNGNYCSVDGVLFDKNKKTLVQYPAGNLRTSYIIPDSVTTIGDYAFYSCKSITSVTIGDSVSTIGDYAFGYSDSLTDVYYTGTKVQWGKISIGSHIYDLTYATIHYEYCPHTNTTKHSKQNATCTKVGYTEGVYCSDCKRWLSGHEEIPKIPHIFTTYTSDKNATLLADGTKTALCDYGCGNKKTVTDKGSKLVLGDVTGLKATPTTSSVTLKWNKAKNATGYGIYYKLSGDLSWRECVSYTTATSYTFKNLPDGTTYTFAIRSVGKTSSKTFNGAYISVKTATKTVKPATVVATQNTSAIKLSWSACKGATGYRIYYKSGSSWKIAVNSTKMTSHTFKNLKSGVKYIFAIRPYIKTDSGVVWSAYKTFTTSTKPANPTAKVTSPSKGKLTVTWNAVNGAESYQVYYKTGNGSYKLYKTYSSAKTLNFKNLKSGTKYTFAVRAVIKTDGGNVRSGYKAVSATVK